MAIVPITDGDRGGHWGGAVSTAADASRKARGEAKFRSPSSAPPAGTKMVPMSTATDAGVKGAGVGWGGGQTMSVTSTSPPLERDAGGKVEYMSSS